MWMELPMLVLCSLGLALHTWSHSVQAPLPQPPLPQSTPLGHREWISDCQANTAPSPAWDTRVYLRALVVSL